MRYTNARRRAAEAASEARAIARLDVLRFEGRALRRLLELQTSPRKMVGHSFQNPAASHFETGSW